MVPPWRYGRADDNRRNAHTLSAALAQATLDAEQYASARTAARIPDHRARAPIANRFSSEADATLRVSTTLANYRAERPPPPPPGAAPRRAPRAPKRPRPNEEMDEEI
jgi:hypothetical protein